MELRATHASAPRGLAALGCIVEFVAWLSNAAATLIFLVLVGLTTYSVLARDFLNISFPWIDDLLRMLLIWSVYLGAVTLCLTNDHITMNVVYVRFPSGIKRVIDWMVSLSTVGVCTYLAYLGGQSVERSIRLNEMTPSGTLPAWLGYLAIPVGLVLMAVATARYTLQGIRHRTDEHPVR